MNYFTNKVCQSFVIDNETGLIYLMEGIYITEIKDGLIHGSDGLIYDMRVGNDREMEFYTIYQNTTIRVSRSFKDGNGHVFVENDSVNAFDEANNVLFYKSGQGNYYFPSAEGETIHIKVLLDNKVSDAKRIGIKWDYLDIAEDKNGKENKNTKGKKRKYNQKRDIERDSERDFS